MSIADCLAGQPGCLDDNVVWQIPPVNVSICNCKIRQMVASRWMLTCIKTGHPVHQTNISCFGNWNSDELNTGSQWHAACHPAFYWACIAELSLDNACCKMNQSETGACCYAEELAWQISLVSCRQEPHQRSRNSSTNARVHMSLNSEQDSQRSRDNDRGHSIVSCTSWQGAGASDVEPRGGSAQGCLARAADLSLARAADLSLVLLNSLDDLP